MFSKGRFWPCLQLVHRRGGGSSRPGSPAHSALLVNLVNCSCCSPRPPRLTCTVSTTAHTPSTVPGCSAGLGLVALWRVRRRPAGPAPRGEIAENGWAPLRFRAEPTAAHWPGELASHNCTAGMLCMCAVVPRAGRLRGLGLAGSVQGRAAVLVPPRARQVCPSCRSSLCHGARASPAQHQRARSTRCRLRSAGCGGRRGLTD